MVKEQSPLHKELSSEIYAELGRHRISISKLAKEIGRNRTTVNLWLLNNTTQIRYDIMHAAIERLVKQKG